mgnify:FL=1
MKYLNIFIQNKKMVFCIKDNFVGLDSIQPPFIIGISGPVAVGKSTTARLLQVLLMYCYPNLNVQLMTTDGFLYSNKELKKKD